MPLYTVPATATYRAADGDTRYYTQDTQIDMAEAVEFGMPGATSLSSPGSSVNTARAYRAVTATTTGSGNGTIPAGTDTVTVTSDDANKIVTLPDGAVGTVLRLRNGATGYELRSAAPATDAINGGTGVAAESAIPANTLVTCVRDTTTTWLCSNTSTAGAITATQVAAP